MYCVHALLYYTVINNDDEYKKSVENQRKLTYPTKLLHISKKQSW